MSSGSEEEDPKRKYWIKDPLVYDSDKEHMVNGKEIRDALVAAAMKILHEQYPTSDGLQSPILAVRLQFDQAKKPAVQILYPG